MGRLLNSMDITKRLLIVLKDNIFLSTFFQSISWTTSRQDLCFTRTTMHSVNFKEEFAFDDDDAQRN